MKSILVLALLSIFAGIELQKDHALEPESVVEWQTETTYDFGILNHRTPRMISFPFKNISEEAIIIENVRTSCGCTAAEWSVAPIEPDSLGQIELEFDSAKPGYFYKKIKVFFSGQRKSEILWIEGEVVID